MVIFEKVLGNLIFSFPFLGVFTQRELGCFQGVRPLSGMPGAVGGAANCKSVHTLTSKGASSSVGQGKAQGAISPNFLESAPAMSCVGTTCPGSTWHSCRAGQPAHLPTVQATVGLPAPALQKGNSAGKFQCLMPGGSEQMGGAQPILEGSWLLTLEWELAQFLL